MTSEPKQIEFDNHQLRAIVSNQAHDSLTRKLAETVITLTTQMDEAIAKEREWRPIETAPKDGHILLAFPLRGVIRGIWRSDQDAKKPRPYWSHDCERIFGVNATRNDQPTHWMPLPDPPEIRSQELPEV